MGKMELCILDMNWQINIFLFPISMFKLCITSHLISMHFTDLSLMQTYFVTQISSGACRSTYLCYTTSHFQWSLQMCVGKLVVIAVVATAKVSPISYLQVHLICINVFIAVYISRVISRRFIHQYISHLALYRSFLSHIFLFEPIIYHA